MSTDQVWLALAASIEPHEIAINAKIYSAAILQMKINALRPQHPAMLWEEWLDARDAWCKRYRGKLVTVVRGQEVSPGVLVDAIAAGQLVLLDQV